MRRVAVRSGAGPVRSPPGTHHGIGRAVLHFHGQVGPTRCVMPRSKRQRRGSGRRGTAAVRCKCRLWWGRAMRSRRIFSSSAAQYLERRACRRGRCGWTRRAAGSRRQSTMQSASSSLTWWSMPAKVLVLRSSSLLGRSAGDRGPVTGVLPDRGAPYVLVRLMCETGRVREASTRRDSRALNLPRLRPLKGSVSKLTGPHERSSLEPAGEDEPSGVLSGLR